MLREIQKIPMQLRASYLAMHRQSNSVLMECGITIEQFVCLLIVYDNDGIIQNEIVRLATSDPNTIRAILLLLEKKGFVRREPHSSDKRARCVRITPLGRQTAEQSFEALLKVNSRIRKLISDEEAAVLNALLSRIANDFSSPSAEE